MKASHLMLNKRQFLRGTLSSAALFSFVPGPVLGLNGATSSNNRLNIACIGVDGRGGANIDGTKKENIVALCDVDLNKLAKVQAQFPKAKTFQDYRQLFDKMGKEIDAVTVSTPDHTHAVVLMRAMKLGKHVYSEKPLAHSVHEIRTLMKTARERNIVTQLGNQGHSSDSIRRFCEMIWSGAIGNVKEVHAYCSSRYSKVRDLESAKQIMPVPETLNWDLWLGPAPFRPYNSCYLPGKWRGWLQFGTGVIGDWICHVVDPVFWALNLGAPSSIQAQVFDYDPVKHAETCPPGTISNYEFAARGKRPPVKLVWYDGTQKPPNPAEMGDEQLPNIGAVVMGDKGKIIYGSHGAGSCRLIPDDKMVEYRKTEQPSRIPKSPGHHEEWLQACKGGGKAGSNFDYGGPLAELALLGVIAFRMPGENLQWDGEKMRFTNNRKANQFLQSKYRRGWSLQG